MYKEKYVLNEREVVGKKVALKPVDNRPALMRAIKFLLDIIYVRSEIIILTTGGFIDQQSGGAA